METKNYNKTIDTIKNLLLADKTIHDLGVLMNKEIRSIEPVSFSSDNNLVKDHKYLYYGKIHSMDGVTIRFKGQPQAHVQGSFQLEAIFDEILVQTTSNRFYFIGYKILLNQ